MECYKLILEKNGTLLHYVFSAKDEAQKMAKLKAWKEENITPYDKYKVFFNGTLEEQEKLLYKFPRPVVRKTKFQNIICWAKGFFNKKEKNILQFDKL